MKNQWFFCYPGLGKSYFAQNFTGTNFKVYEVNVRDPWQCCSTVAAELRNPQLNIDFYQDYLFSLDKHLQGYIFLTGSFPFTYLAEKAIPQGIFLIPRKDCLTDYYYRYVNRYAEHKFEKEQNTAEKQILGWSSAISFFEKAAKTNPNIIFTKPGEYLTDYIDLETGQFKYPELLKI